MLNVDVMGKWVKMYNMGRATREEERRPWKRSHGRKRAPPCPRELSKLPELIGVEWIHNAMCKTKAQDQQITTMEWEYARGCLPKVLDDYLEFI